MILLDIPEPKNCSECIFCNYEQGFCYLSTKDGTLKTTEDVSEYANYADDIWSKKHIYEEDVLYDPSKAKPDWCPASKKLEKIYVITVGSYSDYHVRGVAVSEERANLLKRYYSNMWDGDARIEEYDLDESKEDVDDLIPVYHISIERDGRCFSHQSTWIHEKTGKLVEDACYEESDLGGELNTNPESYLYNYLRFDWRGPAKDEEHALKIAQDERVKALERYLMDHGEEHEKKLKVAEAKEH